jgi:hypothetical protein
MSIVSAVAGAMNGRKNAVPNNNDLMLIEALRRGWSEGGIGTAACAKRKKAAARKIMLRWFR